MTKDERIRLIEIASKLEAVQTEFEANLFAAMFMFLLNGALPIMEYYKQKFKRS